MDDIKKLAVIGAGISGLSAAYFLKDKYKITLYEKSERLGGHSRTINIQPSSSSKPIQVDTGFIVLNDRTYPNLNNLFKDLNIELDQTEMSFSVSYNHGALEWSGTSIDTLFAQRKNIFNFSMLKGILDLLRFNYNAIKYINEDPELTMHELIVKMHLNDWFKEYYILPMGGAIWSCSLKQILDFPAATLVNFFANHGLLNIYNRPQWYTLRNRSIDYVAKMEDLIKVNHEVVKNSKITRITRENELVKVEFENQELAYFDAIIFACHPVAILEILADASVEEKNILTKFSRQKNIVCTHGDPNYMPKLKKCWSSWNYIYHQDFKDTEIAVTYWMNKLQHIDNKFPLFVTLNPHQEIPEDKIYDLYNFEHPVFNHAAIQGQKMIHDLQGKNKLWFCGAYLRYGFHEDGIWSAIHLKNLLEQRKNCVT